MRAVYNLGPEVPNHIRVLATESMMKLKIESLKDKFNEDSLTEEQRQQIVKDILNDPKTIGLCVN
jgi:hypothetical protein